ncbi:MAG: helix-turn-helix domain-containing protein [Microthrixaceae bacterium]|nr:helix-turn-helix domain-containing protein [Microthrixaceae bacterium]
MDQFQNHTGAGTTPDPTTPAPEAPVAVLDAPPERVGLLLADARTRRGLTLAEVADHLGGTLSPGELMAAESGALGIEPAVLSRLTNLYGVSPGDLVPPRDHLVVDLAEGYMRAGTDIALLDSGVGRHDVLSRYLEMIWELRAVEPGERVPLRDADLEVLGSSFSEDAVLLREELEALMEPPANGSVGPGRSRPRRGRVLVGLGLAIAVVTGSALLISSNGPADAAPAEGLDSLPENPTVSIADAQVLERGGTQTTRLESLPPAPQAEIGTAAVQERNPDGTPGEQVTR